MALIIIQLYIFILQQLLSMIDKAKRNLSYYPNPPTQTNPIKYIYLKLLKQSERGFTNNPRMFWIDIQNYTVNYNKEISGLIVDGQQPKSKDSIDISKLRFGARKNEPVLKIEEISKKKEWVLICKSLSERDELAEVLKIISHYLSGSNKDKKQKLYSQLHEAFQLPVRPGTYKLLSESKYSQSLAKSNADIKQSGQKQQQQHQKNPDKQGKEEKYYLKSPDVNNKEHSKGPQGFQNKKQSNLSQQQGFSPQNNNPSSHPQFSSHSRLQNDETGSYLNIHNHQYNKSGLINAHIESQEYDSNLNSMEELGLNDISSIPIKGENNSIDFLQQFPPHQSKQRSIILNEDYIDWNKKFYEKLSNHEPQHSALRIYTQFVTECQLSMQSQLHKILLSSINHQPFIRKGIEYISLNYFHLIKSAQTPKLTEYILKHRYHELTQLYQKIVDCEEQFGKFFQSNRFLMEKLVEEYETDDKEIEVLILPVLGCSLSYVGISVKCEAIVSNENYDKVKDWAAKRAIRQKISRIEEIMNISINLSTQLYQSRLSPSLFLINLSSYPQIFDKSYYSVRSISKAIETATLQQINILTAQLCYPQILNQLIHVSPSSYMKMMNNKYWRRCVYSSFAADIFSRVLRFEIFREVTDYIANKEKGDKSVIHEIITITEYFLQQWINNLISSNEKSTELIWDLLERIFFAIKAPQLQQLVKQETIPGVVLGCVMDKLNLKMWRYFQQQKLAKGKRRAVGDFPIILTYSYMQPNVLKGLKPTKGDNQSGVFSGGINVCQYKVNKVNKIISRLHSVILWSLSERGYIEPWEYQLETCNSFEVLHSEYSSIKEKSHKAFVMPWLESLSESTQLLGITKYVKMYLSLFSSPLTKAYGVYTFEDLPLLQFISLKQNNDSKKKQPIQDLLEGDNVEPLSNQTKSFTENYSIRSQLSEPDLDWQQILPYRTRSLFTRYVIIIKKFFGKKSSYSTYLYNSILEQCEFWFGEFSLNLEPLYLMFCQHFLHQAAYISPTSQRNNRLSNSCIQNYKCALFVNTVSFGKKSFRLAQMHLELADLMTRLISLGYTVEQENGSKKRTSKYQLPTLEIISSIECFEILNDRQGYLKAINKLGKINILDRKYQRYNTNSTKPLLEALKKPLQTIDNPSYLAQLQESVNIIETVFHTYQLINEDYLSQQQPYQKNKLPVSITSIEMQELITKYLCNLNIKNLHPTHNQKLIFEGILSRMIKLVIVYFVNYSDVVLIGNSDKTLRLHHTNRIIQMSDKLPPFKKRINHRHQEIEVYEAFSHLYSSYLTQKHLKIGRISPNKKVQPDENVTLLYFYQHVAMAIDDLAYEAKRDQQEPKRELQKSLYLIDSLIAIIGRQSLLAIFSS